MEQFKDLGGTGLNQSADKARFSNCRTDLEKKFNGKIQGTGYA